MLKSKGQAISRIHWWLPSGEIASVKIKDTIIRDGILDTIKVRRLSDWVRFCKKLWITMRLPGILASISASRTVISRDFRATRLDAEMQSRMSARIPC